MRLRAQIFFWIGSFLLFGALVWVFHSVLLPFVVGAAIAYLLNPLVHRMSHEKFSRSASALVILICFFVVVGAILLVTLPILAREVTGFVQSFPSYIQFAWDKLEPHLNQVQQKLGFSIRERVQSAVQDNMGQALNVGQDVASKMLKTLASGGQAFVSFVTTLLIIPVAAFFMMSEWPRITKWVDDLWPRHSVETIRDLLQKIDRKISGFVRGQILICLALGFLYAIALSLAGLNYGFAIGLATGILSIIPFVGSFFGLIASLLVAALQSNLDWSYLALIAAIFFAGQFIEGNFITPKLMADSVGLHPLWVIFALMAGGALLGLVGMFLAIPVAAIIGVLIHFALTQYKQSSYYA
jgi:predicted PurR-regulated permease PerM